MRGHRNNASLGARYYSQRPSSNRNSSTLYNDSNDSEYYYQFAQLKKQLFDLLKDLELYPRYNRSIGDEKSEFY
jgi:hypothetical protein